METVDGKEEVVVSEENFNDLTFEPKDLNAPSDLEQEFQTQNDEPEETTVVEPDPEVVEPEVSSEDKSIAHFQRVAQKKDDLLKQQDLELQTFKTRLEAIENANKPPEPKKETLQYPREPIPDDDQDMLRFLREKDAYRDKVSMHESAQVKAKLDQIDAERVEANQQKEWQNHRNTTLGQYMEAGMSADKAMKVFNFGYSDASTNALNLEKYFDTVHGQPTPRAKPKLNAGPNPAGAGGAEEVVSDDADSQFDNQQEVGASKRIMPL